MAGVVSGSPPPVSPVERPSFRCCSRPIQPTPFEAIKATSRPILLNERALRRGSSPIDRRRGIRPRSSRSASQTSPPRPREKDRSKVQENDAGSAGPHEPGRSQAMRMVARRTGAIVVVAILAVTVGRGLPAMAQGRGNILTLALHFYPSTLDPAIGVAGPHYRVFVNTYEGLIGYERGTAKVVPSLAQSWTASPDLTTYTFKLRPGVQFHDGTTLDAEAVKLSFDRVKK